MVGPGDGDNLSGGVPLGHGVLHHPAHVGLPHQVFRPVGLPPGGGLPQPFPKGGSALPVGSRGGGVLQRPLPEHVVAVSPGQPVQLSVGVEGFLPLRLLRPLQGQKNLRGKVHKPARRPVFRRPPDGLVLRGVGRQGVEDGAHRGRLGVGQHRHRRHRVRPHQVRQQGGEVAGTFDEHQPGAFFLQQLQKVPGPGGGKVAHAEKDGQFHGVTPPL